MGLAGFLSLLCMALFFWMKFLDGTVEWLEITLCVGGILALALEIFVLPGFGVFGFGGFIMLAAGLSWPAKPLLSRPTIINGVD